MFLLEQSQSHSACLGFMMRPTSERERLVMPGEHSIHSLLTTVKHHHGKASIVVSMAVVWRSVSLSSVGQIPLSSILVALPLIPIATKAVKNGQTARQNGLWQGLRNLWRVMTSCS
jgi:hypothetical protein